MHLTLATWGALCLALVGGATVLVAMVRLRGSAVFRRDLVVAALAILCTAALATALLLNRYRVSRARFGAIFFGLRPSTQPLDSAVIFARGVIVLVAVAGGVLLAGALGLSRAASLLLLAQRSARCSSIATGFVQAAPSSTISRPSPF